MTQQDIRFYFNREAVRINNLPPTTTVLQWLRDHARRPGTKEGCAEGDCGACTVIVAELPKTEAPSAGAIRLEGLDLRPINACIRFLPTLHGKALLTVEDLQDIAGGALHPVQQAMVDCHASQCGFCTPGFVMSLFATYTRHLDTESRPDRRRVADDLAGNLCRCTGYRPILDAAERMFALPPVRLDTAPIVAKLQEIAAGTPGTFRYAARNPAYPAADGARVDRFFAPRSVASLATLYGKMPGARLLAGATDIGIWVNKQFRDVGDLIAVTEVAELNAITADEDQLRIGAAVPLEDAWTALVAAVPECAEMALRFAGPPIRHAGTMGGNIANSSPIGDAAPVLMALEAVLVLQQGQRVRRLRLDEFYLGYMRNALAQGEFLRGIEIPLPGPDVRFRAYKISKRADSDISALSCGAAVTLDGEIVREVRLAFGGMAATAQRASRAEAALRGARWDEEAVRDAMAALERDFTPLSDFRATSSYRLRTARNLLWRFWLETRIADPLPSYETRARATELVEGAV